MKRHSTHKTTAKESIFFVHIERMRAHDTRHKNIFKCFHCVLFHIIIFQCSFSGFLTYVAEPKFFQLLHHVENLCILLGEITLSIIDF